LLSRINLQDDGRTPLHEAVVKGNVAAVKSLIKAGAEMSTGDSV
jgi:ankyrin repeat protein